MRQLKSLCVWLLAACMLVTAAASSSLAASSNDPLGGMMERVKAKKPYRIAVSVIQFTDDYFLGVTYGLLEEAKWAGVEIVRLQSAGGYGKLAEQVEQLNEFAALNIDAVIVSTVAFDGFDRALEQLAQKGVKVIAVATAVNSKHVSVGVLADEVAIGATMAKYVCAKNPKATLVTIPGPAGAEWNKRQFDGFVNEAKRSCPDAKLLGNTFELGSSLEDGQTQAGNLLVKYPDADFVYTPATILGRGALQAVRRMKSKAIVISTAVSAETKEDIKSGQLGMVATYSGILYGRAAVQYAVRLLNGDPLSATKSDSYLPYPYALVPVFSITPENVDSSDVYKFDLAPRGWTPPQH